MLAGLMEKAQRGEELHFSVCLNKGKPIGMCAIYDFEQSRSARIGYWINKDYRGRGYGKEAVRLLVDLAFSDLGIKRIVAVSKNSNGASIRLLTSLGFKEHMQRPIQSGEKVLSLDRE